MFGSLGLNGETVVKEFKLIKEEFDKIQELEFYEAGWLVIIKGATEDRRPYTLVAGFRRSGNYAIGPVQALKVGLIQHPKLQERFRKVIQELRKDPNHSVVFFE